MSDTPARPIFRIVDWDEHFENAGSRRYDNLRWIGIPNRHDSCGFRRLLRQKHGVELYGGFMLIVQVASKLPVRGTLANASGPLSSEDIADRTGAPVEVIQRTLEAVTDPRIGWVERITDDAVINELLSIVRNPPRHSRSRSEYEHAGCQPAQSEVTGEAGEVSPPGTVGSVGPGTVRNEYVEPDPVADGKAPGPGLRITSDESGRAGKASGFRNRFTIEICNELGLAGEAALAQRRPLLAAARTIEGMSTRDDELEWCKVEAREVRAAGMDKPIAAWQARFNKRYNVAGRRKTG